jgi:hypothetical protein
LTLILLPLLTSPRLNSKEETRMTNKSFLIARAHNKPVVPESTLVRINNQ